MRRGLNLFVLQGNCHTPQEADILSIAVFFVFFSTKNKMKYYYYAENNQQFGPFSIEELKSKKLKKSTLVWTDGMQNWDIADSIEELKDSLVSEPPPIPKAKKIIPPIETVQIKQTATTSLPAYSSKYDLNYKRETDATFFGVVLLLLSLLIGLTDGLNTIPIGVIGIAFLIFRILTAVYAFNIASRQNRNSIGWGWFAFFFPAIAMIIIGQLKKLRLKIVIDGNLPTNQQTAILFEKAEKLFSDNRYSECVEVLDKAIEIENDNFNCIELRERAIDKNTES